ncbi:hypothetical protein [Robbsia sp. KACC 23696]|uniref:hypothetical protein n=1 Tax=Robbsia sp. KACC 23696 TaxID=3149231 RepID=UPI00325B30DB
MSPEQKPEVDLDAPEIDDTSNAPHEVSDEDEIAWSEPGDPSNPTNTPLDPIGDTV